ncbi:Fis family transcriptional regulator [Pedobacter changchengzhani]|uniref:Fis family transcriptional regulator n=1 Tax=Pedobacter changchengzhani TaxID=2529274 RepID=A0A4R5MJX4_9SPHI|nr:MMPL family transporter [Pedobacter changchengzhani]TDG35389.1 Fis family transcriptional regulator [Pedobacter changchengzhani]
MWLKLSRFILKNRIALILFFVVGTIFMAFQAKNVKLSYTGSKILPVTDSAFIKYNSFKKTFGEDGSVMVIGIKSPDIFNKDVYNKWAKLSNEIKDLPGIKQVLSTGKIFQLYKDTVNQKFSLKPLPAQPVKTDAEMDSIKTALYNTPFFEGLVFNKDNATLMAITFDTKILNTAKRNPILKQIEEKAKAFQKSTKIQVHISGLPYIRTAVSKLVSNEFVLFLGLSILVSAIILLIFFRKFYAVFFPILVVVMGVIWSIGILVLFGFELTILTGLIPPLIVIIGIPNSILLLNKYQKELRKHGDKEKALSTTIETIAVTTLIANVTAAIGFGVLYFTGSEVLMQFGSVASINVMITWLMCLCLIPIIFSYLPVPKLKPQTDINKGLLHRILVKTDIFVQHKSAMVYLGTLIISIIAFIGVLKINVNGYVVDDLPKSSTILQDLRFFEKNFDGILPLEVSVDTKKKNGVLNLTNLKRIEKMEKMISAYPEFSRSISLNMGLKYATQAFYNNDPAYFRLPDNMEKNFILSYIANGGKGNSSLLSNFVDKDGQKTRISFQMADVGSKRLDAIMAELKPRIDSILPPSKFNVELTGSSVIFSKGTDYMLKHLFESIGLAIVLISLLRLAQFKSLGIMFISLLPNIVPLIITAGIMGYFDISLKPSTILIFTIAFGLASDQTIYFLTRYQQELKLTNLSVSTVITDTITETGVSMTHIALILFFGFGIFTASTFGGTVILGLLLSITLFVALVFNLTLLPALVLWLDKKKVRK